MTPIKAIERKDGLSDSTLLWTFEETRKQIKKSVHAMRWLIRKRALPMVIISNRIYFRPEEIRTWIEEHSIPAQKPKK